MDESLRYVVQIRTSVIHPSPSNFLLIQRNSASTQTHHPLLHLPTKLLPPLQSSFISSPSILLPVYIPFTFLFSLSSSSPPKPDALDQRLFVPCACALCGPADLDEAVKLIAEGAGSL